MFPVVTVTLAAVCALPSPAELVLHTFLETFESCLHIQQHLASMALMTEGKKTQPVDILCFCFYELFPLCFKSRVLLMNLSE